MLLEETRNLLKEVQMSLGKEGGKCFEMRPKSLGEKRKKLWERLEYVSIHTF